MKKRSPEDLLLSEKERIEVLFLLNGKNLDIKYFNDGKGLSIISSDYEETDFDLN